MVSLGTLAVVILAIYLEKEKKKPALKNFPMLGETNNQFYMALNKNHRNVR
jgi:hypothetical protein